MPERITIPCLAEAIGDGSVLPPEVGVNACAVEADPATPRRSINIRSLPFLVCEGCGIGDNEREAVIYEPEADKPMQLIGNNPIYIQTQIKNRCKKRS